MESIQEANSLHDLMTNIESGASIAVDKHQGTWHVRWDPWGITSFFRKLFGFEQSDNVQLISFVSHCIKSTEITSDKYRTYGDMQAPIDPEKLLKAVKQRMKSSLQQEKNALKQENAILSDTCMLRDLTQDALNLEKEYHEGKRKHEIEERLHAYNTEIRQLHTRIRHLESKAYITNKINKLKIHLLAKKMRETSQVIIQKHHSSDLDRSWLKNTLCNWKTQQFPKIETPYTENGEPIFSESEQKKIEDLLAYPKAIRLMQKSRSYQDFIFKFVFRNTNGNCPNAVDIAIQFPVLTKKIGASVLDKRIKRLPAHLGLKLQEEIHKQKVHKDVVLRMQKKYEPLRDFTRKITFIDPHDNNDRILTIEKIFYEFYAKTINEIGDFEYTEDGISLCHPTRPSIAWESETWWQQLPVLERLSRSEVENRHAIDMTGKKAVLIVKATRGKDPLNVEGNHGWLQIVVPQDNGTFTTHAIGKYAAPYPQGAIESLFFVFGSQLGILSAIDENEFYSHRDEVGVPIALNDTQFHALLKKLHSDFHDSMHKKMIFQAQGNNCAAWVQDVLDTVFGAENIPRIFNIPILETRTPEPIVNNVIDGIRWLDSRSHGAARIVRLAIAILLGGSREVEIVKEGHVQKYSTITHEPWLKGSLALPAVLFSNEKRAKLKEAFQKLSASL